MLLLFILIVLFLVFSPTADPLQQNKGDGRYLISHVNIIDVANDSVISDQSIVVENNRITRIVSSDSIANIDGFTVINAEGKYAMPGLWDMHTHSLKLSPQLHHPLFVGHGITSIRDMSGCLTDDDSYWACPQDRSLWQQQTIRGERVSPRYALQSSYQTNGGNEVPAAYPDFFRLEHKFFVKKC